MFKGTESSGSVLALLVRFAIGRSGMEISTAIRLHASAAHAWCNDLGVFVASIGAHQALGDVTPLNLVGTMRKLELNATLTEAILREQIGGRYCVSLPRNRR